MIYRKCSELPLSIFIRVILEDNINLIAIGDYNHEEIAKTWADIYSEYFELSDSNDCKHMINTAKSIAIAENKITIINAAVAILRHGHNDNVYKVLSSIGFPLKRIDDKEERLNAIESMVTKAKSLVHIITNAERDIERMNSGNKPLNEQDYIENMVILGKYQGFRIDPEITTVAEYLAIQKNYKKELEWHKKNQ